MSFLPVILLSVASLAGTYAVLRFDGSIWPRNRRHGAVAAGLAICTIVALLFTA